MKRLAIIVLSLCIFQLSLFGFDGDRNKLIAGIAQKYLIDTKAIDSYNDSNKQFIYSLIDVATWADDSKYDIAYPGIEQKTTDQWHYTDLDVTQSISTVNDYLMYMKANTKSKDTLFAQLPSLVATLQDTKAPLSKRYIAFKYLVHFIGDASMPLHCADRDNDAGGNGKAIDFTNPIKKNEKLHHLWDGMPTTFQYTENGTSEPPRVCRRLFYVSPAATGKDMSPV